MTNETQIANLLLKAPARPEPSFQVSSFETDSPEQFDYVLQSETRDSGSRVSQNLDRPENPAASHPAPPEGSTAQSTSHPARSESINHKSDSPAPASTPAGDEPVNPFALPEEALNGAEKASPLPDQAAAQAIEAIADLTGSQGLGEQAAVAIDSFKEALAALNIDPELIDKLAAALEGGDAAGLQGILNALRGLLQASNHVAQAQGVEAAGAASNLPEQLALALLVRAGLTQEQAQQVIQQAQTANSPQPLNDNTTAPLTKSIADALAPKTIPDSSNGSGTLQNSGQGANGSTQQNSETPRNLTGLAGERLDTLSNLVAPDKAGHPPTNPLLAKGAVSPLLNAAQTGASQVQGILAEAAPGQAPAALADSAARAADFVKPAVTETYNGRAAMDKPITAQIIEKISMRGFGNQREVHIKLDPPSLGTVRMNVSASGDSIRATIVAENNIVKSVIENNLAQLKDSITHQGVKIDSFNVLVGGNASHSAEGHKAGLDFLDQLGREGTLGTESAEEVVTFHRPVFLYENQSISLFA